jgi:hypothetical protein
MTMTDNKLLEKPQPPADEECCGSGVCDPCVWDRYYAELQQWRLAQAQRNQSQEHTQGDETED